MCGLSHCECLVVCLTGSQRTLCWWYWRRSTRQWVLLHRSQAPMRRLSSRARHHSTKLRTSRHRDYPRQGISHCHLSPLPLDHRWQTGLPALRMSQCLLHSHSRLIMPLVVRHCPPHLAPPTLILLTHRPSLLASHLLLVRLRGADLFENSFPSRLVQIWWLSIILPCIIAVREIWHQFCEIRVLPVTLVQMLEAFFWFFVKLQASSSTLQPSSEASEFTYVTGPLFEWTAQLHTPI